MWLAWDEIRNRGCKWRGMSWGYWGGRWGAPAHLRNHSIHPLLLSRYRVEVVGRSETALGWVVVLLMAMAAEVSVSVGLEAAVDRTRESPRWREDEAT